MVHDYRTKETEIDLVRESRLMEKAVIRNKVKSIFEESISQVQITSGYNIGTSLTYHINDKVRVTHSAETDLRRFFKMQENYKYGVKLEVDL